MRIYIYTYKYIQVKHLCATLGMPLLKPTDQSSALQGARDTIVRVCSFVLRVLFVAYVSIREHTWAYVSIREHTSRSERDNCAGRLVRSTCPKEDSIRQHVSAYVSIRQGARGAIVQVSFVLRVLFVGCVCVCVCVQCQCCNAHACRQNKRVFLVQTQGCMLPLLAVFTRVVSVFVLLY